MNVEVEDLSVATVVNRFVEVCSTLRGGVDASVVVGDQAAGVARSADEANTR